jgi:hypothetical protein
MGTPFGESADFLALTLCIKLSMSLIYQLIPIYKSTVASDFPEPPKVREVVDDHAPVHPTHCGGCEEEAFGRKTPGSLGKRMYWLRSLLTDQTVPLSGVCEGC